MGAAQAQDGGPTDAGIAGIKPAQTRIARAATLWREASCNAAAEGGSAVVAQEDFVRP